MKQNKYRAPQIPTPKKNYKVEDDTGEFWYYGDMMHRDGDLPAQIHRNGVQIWMKHGRHHRTTGPCVIYAHPREFTMYERVGSNNTVAQTPKKYRWYIRGSIYTYEAYIATLTKMGGLYVDRAIMVKLTYADE